MVWRSWRHPKWDSMKLLIVWQNNLQIESKTIKLISYSRKIWKTCMTSSCLSRVKAQKMTQCLLRRDLTALLVQRMWWTWLDLERTIMRGVISHLKTQARECPSKDKDSPKCIPKVNTRDLITKEDLQLNRVQPIWWKACLTETICSKIETSKLWREEEESAHLEGGKIDLWQPKPLEVAFTDKL